MSIAGDTRTQTSPDEGKLEFDNISHSYISGIQRTDVLNQVSFSVPQGKVACVVGPSGCGKSTLLDLAAGLQSPSAGFVRWSGKAVKLGPNNYLGMAFQQPGLFPWMTVRQNIAVGLTTRGIDKNEARRTADEILGTVGLLGFEDAYPNQLSGGMAQRVGIARALALKPQLLLMDEPFASVDAFTRIKLQQEFKLLLKLNQPTVLFVTHDVSEAILLGDVIVVMSQRPATVQRLIPINPEDRVRSNPAYARKLSDTLDCLGVTSELES